MAQRKPIPVSDGMRQPLLSKVSHDGDCWTWQGTLSDRGYGMFHFQGQRFKAHRVSYVLFVGPLSDDLVLDHLCRNRACINPAHLDAVPQAVNLQRGERAVIFRTGRCREGHDIAAVGQDKSGMCRACARARRRERYIRQRDAA